MSGVGFSERMLEEHIAFVQLRAGVLSTKFNVPKGDLVQSGLIGINEASKKYDGEAFGTKFLTYARFFITREMYKDIRANRTVKPPKKNIAEGAAISISDPIALDTETTLEDIMGAECDVREEVHTREKNEKLHSAINKLKPVAREILYEYFYEEKSYEEIGEKRGVTKQAVQQRIAGILKNLREKLATIET